MCAHQKKKNEKIIQKGEKNERTNSFAAVKCKPHTNKSHLHMQGNFICMKCDVAYQKKKKGNRTKIAGKLGCQGMG